MSDIFDGLLKNGSGFTEDGGIYSVYDLGESGADLEYSMTSEPNHIIEEQNYGGKLVSYNPVTRKIGEVPPPELRIRDQGPRNEEREGKLIFKIIRNDGKRENLKYLVDLKEIFSKQLPKMPVEYITRLVFDRKHMALAMIREGIVIGGIQFRPFPERDFIEIVFLAVTQQKQVSGYGSYLMNNLKVYAQKNRIHNFLTYADNFAVTFFKKQGFSREIDLDRSLWGGVIKDYDGGTLMHCQIMDCIDYMEIPRIIHNQRICVLDKFKEFSTQHIIWEGLKDFKEGACRIALDRFQPLLDMGWNPSQYTRMMSPEIQKKIRESNKELLKTIREDKASWPFLIPVDGTQVTDYYTTILDPIDLETIEKKLNDGYYITQEMLFVDIQRMVDNCKRYNGANTEYYTCATQIENRLKRWKVITFDLSKE